MHHAILGGVNFQFFFPEALIPFAPYMQNPSSFRPQGAILRAPSHTKLGFAIPLFEKIILKIFEKIILKSQLEIHSKSHGNISHIVCELKEGKNQPFTSF